MSGCIWAAGPGGRGAGGRRRDAGRKRQITFQGTGSRSSSHQIFISHTAPEALPGLPLGACVRALHTHLHIYGPRRPTEGTCRAVLSCSDSSSSAKQLLTAASIPGPAGRSLACIFNKARRQDQRDERSLKRLQRVQTLTGV